MVPEVTRTAMRRRGFAAARVLLDWPDIVGPALVDACRPERLKRLDEERAELILRVRPAMALEVQHLAPLMIERINSHFGFRAVTQIRLVQGSVPPRKRTRARPAVTLSEAEQAGLARKVATVTDPDLRAVLERLGTGVLTRTATRKQG
ncbi:MAG: DUF721 domain-containing protein [Alphaproteobacteria bacterium]|nr:MAG: DUF721 domain-containing protein [Alphaproteobacteria bacterium]